jgi:hypothetical protein
MKLRKKPFKPTSLPVTPISRALAVTRSEMPEAWLRWLPAFNGHEGSDWVA